MASILPPFLKFHAEGSVVGRLLAGYAGLEIDLMNCVAVVRDDLDAVLKTMFRTRGETARVLIADALGRNYYHDHSLGTEFELAVSAVRCCLKIRNHYAHCIWYDDNSGKLAFVNLEEIAKSDDLVLDLTDLTVFYVDLALLQKQEAYFVYSDDLLRWVNYEGRTRAGKLATNPVTKPAPATQPLLHLPSRECDLSL